MLHIDFATRITEVRSIFDDLTEQETAALALSPLDDLATNAWAVLESAASVTYAWITHASTLAAPVSDFQKSWPGGYSPMSGINSKGWCDPASAS